MIKRFEIIVLVLILTGAFFVRLYKIDNPIADWHSWRQADTSAVSRNFVTHGFDVLHPRFDDLSNVPSGKENPNGYRFVEFPLFNIAQAGFFKVFGLFTLEEWGRLVSIFSSVAAGLFLYGIVSRHSNKRIGLLSAFFYAFTPYNIYYGRTILPDTSMSMAILGGIYFFDKWLEERSKDTYKKLLYYFLTILFTASAFLLKPYAVFFTLPMLYLAWKSFRFTLWKQSQLWVFIISSFLPLILWRIWMMQYSEGIPVSAWLLNGNGIRFHPAFFRWMVYERLVKLISGYIGILVLFSGLVWLKKIKEWMFFISFILSSTLYVVIFATGNVQHDYYQILIMPTLAIFFAIGSYFLYIWSYREFPLGKIVLAISLISFFWFGWHQIRDYFNINNPSLVVVGAAVDRLTPKNAKVMALYGGDTSFLYQTKRQGWASFEHSLPEMVKLGARYLVLINPNKSDYDWTKSYKLVSHSTQYLLFDLSKPL